MTGQDWVDVRIRTSIDAGELLGLLDDAAVQGGWEENGTVHLYWPSHSWGSEVLGRLRQVLIALNPDSRSDQAIQVEPLPTQDWNRRWAESVKPIRVGRRLIIRPSWEPVRLETKDVEIVLDPKQAFGTGHHATTSLLLEWLEKVVRGGESVLDVGTGSGILAMVALRLGAAKAVGLDVDPVAIDCARSYARDNHFGAELILRTADLRNRQLPLFRHRTSSWPIWIRRRSCYVGTTLRRMFSMGRGCLSPASLPINSRSLCGRFHTRECIVPANGNERDGWRWSSRQIKRAKRHSL